MRRRVKRVICSLLVAVIVLGIVFPIFPEGILSVNADGKDDDRVNILFGWANTLQKTSTAIAIPTKDGDVKEYNFFDKVDDTLKKGLGKQPEGFIDGNFLTAMVQLSNTIDLKEDKKRYGLILNPTIANLQEDGYSYYSDKMSKSYNRWDDKSKYDNISVAVKNIPDDIVVIDAVISGDDEGSCYMVDLVIAGYSVTTEKYYYYLLALTDNQKEKSWDTLNMVLLESDYLMKFEVEFFEDNGGDVTEVDSCGIKYEFEDFYKEFGLTDDDKEIIKNDIISGTFTDLASYDFIDSISRRHAGSHGELDDYQFGSTDIFVLYVDYTSGEYKENDEDRDSDYDQFRGYYSIEPGFSKFKDMKDVYNIDVSNSEYLNFGASKEIVTINPDADEDIMRIATQLSMVIQAICAVDLEGDNDKWEKYANVYVDKLAEKYEDSILYEVKNFMSEMKKARETWVIDGMGADISIEDLNHPEYTINNAYNILCDVIAYNIKCTASKTVMSKNAEMKINNGTQRIKLTFDSANIGSADYCLKTLYDELTDVQKLMLSYSYNFLYDTRFSSKDYTNRWSYLNYKAVLNSIPEYQSDVSSALSGYSQVSIDSIKATVNRRDETITNTRSVYNVARNANSLGQYIIGISLYNEASNESDSNGIYSIYDSTLHSMYHLNYEWSGINEGYFPLTTISNIGLLEEKSTSGVPLFMVLTADDEEDLEIFLQFLYNLTYAFDVAAFSEGAEASGYTVDDIKAALEGDEKSPAKAELTWISESNNLAAWKSVGSTNTAKDLQLQGQDFSIGMIRSIIELHDFCEFLGILDDSGHLKIKWTPAIEEYLNLYAEYEDIFEAFRQNEYIYSMAEKGETTVEEPLGKFFNIEKKQLTDNWIKGFAVSSQYVPMETNLYDATSINMIEDSDWVSDFYYKYAFYRKALYINVDNSAIVNEFVSTEKSTTRVATLSDLLNYERDIVLYIDDNFYNADDVNTVISKIDYTSVRQNTDATATEDGNVITDLTNWAAGAFSLSPQQILKTGSETYYSNTIAQNCTKLNKTDTNNPNLLSKVIDAYLISNDEILGKNGKESVLNDYEYSVKQSYGVVSAVYKSETLYNETLKAIVADNALFKSSKAICYTPGTSSSDWRSLYNYYMLANLEEQMKNDASSTLDLNAPIFCDIFGNIVTESGLVIIPAACNATLCGKYWTPYTIGWAEYYNNGNHIKEGELNDDVYTWLLGFDYESYVNGGVDADGNVVVTSTERNKSNGGGHFEIDRNGELILRTTSINSGNLSAIIQWSTLSKNSTIIKQLFFNDAYFNKGMNMYNSRIVNLVVETLRGAPIEAIDYEYEGLDGNQDISKYGVYMAYKLEEITNSLISGTNGNAIGGNAVVTMPNLAFVDGIEYIVLYVFKIVFAIAVVGLAISLYMDAVINKLGVASVGKFVITVLMVIFAITLVPNIITWSYYKANKDILKEEVGYVMMLNYCKTYDGSEIGITKVTTPETSTELFLKIDDISVDWWSIIDDVLFKDTFATVDELYDSQLDGNLMSELPDVQKKGDGLYIDVQDIYDSTKLNYMPATGVLKNTVYGTGSKASSVDTVASFTLPYYVILEQLIANVNEYNIARDITAYSYSVGNNGNIYTYGVIGPYLTSDEFLSDGYDILGLDRILRTGTNRVCYNFAFDESDVQSMELSQWYPTEAYTIDMHKVAIENIYSYARQYVANNASLIGKVPDEVFLKVMAMQVAVECNKEFLAPYGKSIEIMNIDTRDLARFMVSDRASMYKYYSYGYARYVYEQAGGIGVIFAGFYIALLWITSFLKPLFMIIILGLLIINAIFRKVLFRKENKAIEGYLIGCMCLCITNYAYAFMLKVSLNIANTSLGSITALACAFIVQIAYIACLIGILRIEIKDWKNSGYGEFMNVGANIMAGVNHTKQLVVEKFMVKHNTAYGDTQQSRRAEYSIDEPTVDDMLDRDAEREMNAADNPV